MPMMRRPIRLPTSSTASAAVPFLTSRIGLTSTTSNDVTFPDSLMSSMTRCASRYVRPPRTGVPTPGATSGSTTSRSNERWTRSRCDRSFNARLTTRAAPWASTSFIVYTWTPASARSFLSSKSTERSPTTTTSSGRTLAPSPPMPTSSGRPRPARTASGMPWMLPDGEVAGVLKSACASSHSNPVRPVSPAAPETVPMAMEWSPPRNMGKRPSETILAALWAARSQTRLTAPTFFTSASSSTVSGMGVSTLPKSVTEQPRSSSASARRAYRIADGPMSTPRRSCPRSIGTPSMPTGRLVPPLPGSLGEGHPSRAAGIGRRLELPLRGAAHRVDAAEVHVRLVVGEDTAVAGEVPPFRAGLVGEQVALGVDARGVDGRFERHPEIHGVYQRLRYGGGDARSAGGSQRDHIAAGRRHDRRAHAGDETLPGRERVEAPGVQLGLAQGVVHRDAGAGDDDTGPVAHARRDRDRQPRGVHAREVGRVGGAEGRAEDALALAPRVLLARQACSDPHVVVGLRVGHVAILERVLHRPGEDPRVLGVGEVRQIVGGDDT